MAEETKPAGIASRVTVKHLASPAPSAGVAEVLVTGRRVAYVFYDAELTVSFLPRDMHKLKLTAAELREIVTAAQAQAKPLAEAEAKEAAELKALGV